ncbi:MAG: hypothetical protein HY360_18660 [Verrucomicrobia bacterium]|nr:hypothetical protein [Verrucomicrobiota bacterium]
MKPIVLHRWVEILSLDHSFEMIELDRLAEYGITGVTLWSSFEWARSTDVDNYYVTLPLVYRKHADLNAIRDQDMILRGAHFLRDYSLRAHHHGLKVLHAYHLCNFVGARMGIAAQIRAKSVQTGLLDKRLDWFNEQGEPDFSTPHFYEFMATEAEEFLDAFPHVDGLFCWNCEGSSYTPARLKHQTVSKAEIARRAMKAVYEVCQRRGKIMTHDIHTAGANKELSQGIIDAAADLPELILGADATYSDWHLHLDTCPWLAQMKKHNRIYMGFDASGEFFGQGRTIGGWPRWITKHFNAGKKHGLDAVSIRSSTIAKDNSCLVVPMLEFNLRVALQLALHGEVNLDAEIKAWWKRHFSGELPEGMKDVFLSFEDYIEKALYINGCNITEYNPDHGFSLKAVHVAPGYPCWHSEQFMRPGTPLAESMCRMIPPWGQKSRPVQELRQEKLDAIATCDNATAKVKAMKMAEEDRAYFLRKLQQARDFAEAYLLTINVVHPLYQLLGEHHDKTMTDPRSALREELRKFLAFADTMEERWGSEWYRRFVPKMREFAADIPPKLYQ